MSVRERAPTSTGVPAVGPAVVRAPGRGRGRDRAAGNSLVWLALSDACAFLIALLIITDPTVSVRAAVGTVLGVAAAICVMAGFRLYRPATLIALAEAGRIVAASAVLLLLVVLASGGEQQASDRDLGAAWALLAGLLLAERLAWRARRRRVEGRSAAHLRPALILASADQARLVARSLELFPSDLHVVGRIHDDDRPGGEDDPAMLGSIEGLEAAVFETGATCLVLVATCFEPQQVLEILRGARALGVEVRVCTGLPLMAEARLHAHGLADTMVLEVALPRLTPFQGALKRSFDVAASAMLLVLFAVPMAMIAIAVRVTSPGGAIFRQTRVTLGGRGFTMYKFRTMVPGATTASAPKSEDRSRLFFKLGDNDPRITGLGHVLRKTSLDELPQLWNVLRGDMSLVGPRPLPIEQVKAHVELLDSRHAVRAGISGWWQVNGRSSLSPTASVEMDLFYIDNWSLWLDLTILAKTFGAVLSQRGAG
jgi:exopolysaccharide biosynthesis polyprenyl glycosylphosphotransferase